MRYILVRHPPAAIAPGICYGRLDPALRDDATKLVHDILTTAAADTVQVWTSPATRCRLLAEPVAHALKATLVVDPRLHELDFGAWEGVPWSAIPRPSLDAWAAAPIDFAPPGGESGQAILARVRAVHRAIVATRQDCVIVSHGGPLKLLAALFRQEPPDLLAPAPLLGSVQVLTA